MFSLHTEMDENRCTNGIIRVMKTFLYYNFVLTIYLDSFQWSIYASIIEH